MTTGFPHLTKSPIQEAVLDIKTEPSSESTNSAVALFVARVGDIYPETHPIDRVEATFDAGAEPPVTSERLRSGAICWNGTKTRAVQGRLDGFTVNQVRTYESWETLRTEAERLWLEYTQTVKPARVVRCALRYINRLELPVQAEVSRRLATRPELSAELPQIVEDLFMRVVVPFGEGRKAAIAQASEPPIGEGATARGLILDIDAFSTRAFEIGDPKMWDELEELRHIKNQCFFKSLTPAAWEPYL